MSRDINAVNSIIENGYEVQGNRQKFYYSKILIDKGEKKKLELLENIANGRFFLGVEVYLEKISGTFQGNLMMKILKSIFNPFLLLSVFSIQFCELFSQLVEFETELSSNKLTFPFLIQRLIFDSYWRGLDMYDGNNIHNFQSILSRKNSLLNSSIQNIIEIDDKLLFVSKDGLSIFNRENIILIE